MGIQTLASETMAEKGRNSWKQTLLMHVDAMKQLRSMRMLAQSANVTSFTGGSENMCNASAPKHNVQKGGVERLKGKAFRTSDLETNEMPLRAFLCAVCDIFFVCKVYGCMYGSMGACMHMI